jgi:hypothetical protein
MKSEKLKPVRVVVGSRIKPLYIEKETGQYMMLSDYWLEMAMLGKSLQPGDELEIQITVLRKGRKDE